MSVVMGEQVAGARVAAAASAAAFVVLDGAALFLPGAPPRAGQSAEEIAATLAGHRGRLLASVYVGGLALLALIAFVVTLRRRPARDPGLVTAALGSAGVAMALQLTGLVLFYGAAFRVASQGDLAVVRGLTDAGNAAIAVSKFAFAAFVAGLCLAVPDGLTPAMRRAGAAAAALLALSAVSLLSDGAVLQFGGPVDLLGSAPAVAWLVALSVGLAREAPAWWACAGSAARPPAAGAARSSWRSPRPRCARIATCRRRRSPRCACGPGGARATARSGSGSPGDRSRGARSPSRRGRAKGTCAASSPVPSTSPSSAGSAGASRCARSRGRPSRSTSARRGRPPAG